MPAKKPSAVVARLVDYSAEILGEVDPAELRYLHTVLAQCGLPYRDPAQRDYIRTNGGARLVVTAGYLENPKTKELELQGIPFGAKARLLMIHLCTEAVIRQSDQIPIQDSMSAFMKHDLGLAVTGGKKGSISLFKEQLNRLAAAHMQVFIGTETEQGRRVSMQNLPHLIEQYDVWFPKNPSQRVLWPSTIRLSTEFFNSLKQHALPIDPRAVKALQQSALALDCYTWAAHRLPRVKAANGERISWAALKSQFGPEYERERDFREVFKGALRKMLAVYPKAKIESDDNGFKIRKSLPPVMPKVLRGI